MKRLWHRFWLRWHIRRQNFMAAVPHMRALCPQAHTPADIQAIVRAKFFDLL